MSKANYIKIMAVLGLLGIQPLPAGSAPEGAAPGKIQEQPADYFAAPERGFVSRRPAANWQHSILTGNGMMGVMVPGDPFDETLYLSHGALYLPREKREHPIIMREKFPEMRELCLAGKYAEAGKMVDAVNKEMFAKGGATAHLNDPFIGGLTLRIEQEQVDLGRYQRSVDFMTGETHVSYATDSGVFHRGAFVSRADDVIVVRLNGSAKQNVELSFAGLTAASFKEIAEVAKRVKRSESGALENKGLYFRNIFATPNVDNPLIGYEAVGRIVQKGGQFGRTHPGFRFSNADEVLVLIKIRPLLKEEKDQSFQEALQQELEALPADYDQLLARHAKIHGELMDRVSFSLNAPASDRAKATEDLLKAAQGPEVPLAQIERAFEAGRYNMISCIGYNPPNLQGLWNGSWLAPWGSALTTDGNLPCAVSFLAMGNTPELLDPYFRFYERFLPGFRKNMEEILGMRGFLVPAQLTSSPRFMGVSSAYPFYCWYAGAPWMLQYYYDYWLTTGDRKFLEERAYPLMKETAAFYEDFLTVTDKAGHLVFAPSYSPENAPSNDLNARLAVNATMEIGAAKQLLRNAITAARELGVDEELRRKWAALIDKMPPYEVGEDGSFREWLWPGLAERHDHRHASHFYPLYDEMPPEIVENPALVKAVGHSGRARLDYLDKSPVMAFGLVQVGLGGARVGDSELAARAIHTLGKRYWSTGMGSFHCGGHMFNMDISGGLPYLCASTLVYSDPGLIRFFPARPPQWQSGSIKGLRLRGAITLKDLTWDGAKAKAVLVSDKDQTVSITGPGLNAQNFSLSAGKAVEVHLKAKSWESQP